MTRRAWMLVTAAYVVMAIGFAITAFALDKQADNLKATTTELERQAAVDAEQEQVDQNTIEVIGGALCLVTYTETKAESQAIIRNYANGEDFSTSKLPPICQQAVARAVDTLTQRGTDGNP